MYFAAALVLLVVTLDLHGVMHRASRRTRRGHTFLSRPGGSRGWAALATLHTFRVLKGRDWNAYKRR